MSVSEDKVPGEEVGRLKAKDPDLEENGLVAYRLIDGDGMNVFELTTDSETREAVIKLKKVKNDVKLSSWNQSILVGSSEEVEKKQKYWNNMKDFLAILFLSLLIEEKMFCLFRDFTRLKTNA